MDRLIRFGLVAFGAVVGGTARYLVALLLPTARDGFPTATFVVNVSGSFLLGVAAVVMMGWVTLRPRLWALVVTGVLGAFSTFSTFAVEIDQLVRHGATAVAAAYLVASVVGGSAAAWMGLAAGRAIAGRETSDLTADERLT